MSIIFYHKNCLDGFASAMVARKYFGDNAEYVPIQYGDDPLQLANCDDKAVYFIDFSIPPEKVLELSAHARKIIIIDHHETAVRKLQENESELGLKCGCPIAMHFDMDKSGARMAWDYFFGGQDAPRSILMIEDRDLWRFNYPETKAFNAAMASRSFDFEEWGKVFDLDSELPSTNISTLVQEGRALLRQQAKSVDILAAHASYRGICGYKVPCVNASYMFASDLGNLLSLDAPFAAIFTIALDEEKIIFSLRSSKDYFGHVNVAEIAEQFGGGGHKHSAGFAISLVEQYQIIDWLGGYNGADLRLYLEEDD